MSALDRRTPAPQTCALPDGRRFTIRRARLRDRESLQSLAARAGIFCEELELARLVRSDPGERLVLCATPTDSDSVLGIGVIELGRSATMPSLVLVDPLAGDGLASALAGALVESARALAGSIVA